MQPTAHAGGRQLGGDLAQQLVAKPPAVGSRRLEDQRILEFVDDVVDLVVAQVDHRAQQAAIHLAADDRGGLQHRHHLCTGAQPGEQRLIQRLGHPGLTESGHDLFDVERHPVAAVDHQRPLIGRQRRIQRGDQRVGLLVGQRCQVEHLDRPTGRQPSTGASGQDHQQPTSGCVQQRAEDLEGGRIEPVQVLGHHQPGTTAQTGQQIGLHRLGDQLVEFAAFGGHRLIARLGADSQYRRQQRHGGLGSSDAGPHLGVEEPEPLVRDR